MCDWSPRRISFCWKASENNRLLRPGQGPLKLEDIFRILKLEKTRSVGRWNLCDKLTFWAQSCIVNSSPGSLIYMQQVVWILQAWESKFFFKKRFVLKSKFMACRMPKKLTWKGNSSSRNFDTLILVNFCVKIGRCVHGALREANLEFLDSSKEGGEECILSNLSTPLAVEGNRVAYYHFNLFFTQVQALSYLYFNFRSPCHIYNYTIFRFRKFFLPMPEFWRILNKLMPPCSLLVALSKLEANLLSGFCC